MTEYIILRYDDDCSAWEVETAKSDGEIVPVKASSPRQALRNLGAGKYVAVPFRSWKPLTVKTEQVTKVTIG